jgi:hypothetical protein
MDTNLVLSNASRTTAGILLLAIVTIESGGWYMLQLVRGRLPATPFQLAFSRAGHAHAGVLVTLSLVCQLFVDNAGLSGFPEIVARDGVAAAAILMPAGFFFSSIGRDIRRPNRFILLIYLGALCLAAGVIALGVGLLTV